MSDKAPLMLKCSGFPRAGGKASVKTPELCVCLLVALAFDDIGKVGAAALVLKAGQDSIVKWSLNTTVAPGTDSAYKMMVVKLCYAPVSQKDRGWRKTVDDLKKDKTCQHDIVTSQYSPSSNTYTWTVARDVPTATYFVRSYAENAELVKVAFGQTTDSNKTTNLFQVQAISGRHVSLDISAICFSAFSILSLFGFFFMEKRKAKASQQK
ncbi:hypothetical protein F511_08226 [Dorcoceras hygrometricum]|uniref:High-affinity nitrate transporter n=1 Tax=Dorcoceras hygrometricum TaxID=472368 RepID=A0A2Z7BZC9_9LAMI|nr:hypothetical protein F511_08226 [Dorcoceras hygrometricum]